MSHDITPGVPSQPHASPTQLAFRRMRRHRLGMLGLWLVAIMAVGVVCVPLLSRQAPETTRPWLGALPPGAVHPDCAVENTFVVGQPADTTARASACRMLAMTIAEAPTTDYRVVLRRGRIHSIQQGAVAMDAFDLAAQASGAREVLADGSLGRDLPRVRLAVGDRPPDGFMPTGQRVVILRTFGAVQTREATVRMSGGQVEAITLSDPGQEAASVESLVVRGSDVVEMTDTESGERLTVRHWFGTDELGRDLLVRVFYGGRISMLVGIVATAVSLLIGLSYGAIAGYAGGRVDRAMMGVVDVLYAVPFLFLVIVLMVAFGRNIVMLFVALGAVQWLTMARIVRGQILSLKEMEFVEAARLGGARPWHVVFRELIPHTVGPVIVYTTLTVPVVIMGESFLAFIGLQVQYHGIALDSWGALINRGVQALGQGGEKSWMLVFPALAMVLTLFGLNSLGDGLRDSFDPKGMAH